MKVLGIETSCDETAAAIVTGDGQILSNIVLSQLEDHAPFGGVVPEVAARAHLAHIDDVITRALDGAGMGMADIDAVAATGGPGLIGGVMVGVMAAKAIALARSIPFLAVNHLEGHALTARLTNQLEFPYLMLLVSGGHTQLLAVAGVGRYRLLGATMDDAAGEAFDKSAKLLGLGYPGGPALEALAAEATNPARFELPRPLLGRPGCDFSFSGLKTAVKRAVDALPPGDIARSDAADLAAATENAIATLLADRSARALAMMADTPPTAFVAAGGVAANGAVRAALARVAEAAILPFIAPPPRLCTDNAAMIAWAGIERLRLGHRDGLDFAPRPRWPLEETRA